MLGVLLKKKPKNVSIFVNIRGPHEPNCMNIALVEAIVSSLITEHFK